MPFTAPTAIENISSETKSEKRKYAMQSTKQKKKINQETPDLEAEKYLSQKLSTSSESLYSIDSSIIQP